MVQAEVKSFKAARALTAEGKRYCLYPLFSFDPHQSFETYYFEIDPGATFSGEPHKGNIYEYVFVIKGQLQIEIDDKSFRILENEFLQFKADHPPRYICLGKRMASAIMQISCLA
ncbi:cupin domain-containing protein [Desulfocastanea catecholica]